MQNKLNQLQAATSRFDVINKQILRTIKLVTDVATSFQFSEPIVSDCELSLVSDSIPSVISNFKFCEPLKELKNEETEILIESLSLLNICGNDQSDVLLESSTQCSKESGKEVVSSSSQDINHNDVNKSTDPDPNTQITHLHLNNNEHNPPPVSQKQYDKQPLPLLIRDVHKITWPNKDVCYVPVMDIFGQTFETVMIYGIVTSLNIENGGLLQRFVIDDGSSSITVVWKANNQMIGKFNVFTKILK